MRGRRLSLAALIALGVGAGLIASCSRGGRGEGPSGEARGAKIAALELPGAHGAPRRPREFVWAEGVAEAAAMYFPREMPVYRAVHVAPRETAAAVAAALGEPLPAEADDRAAGGTGAHRVRLGGIWVGGFADGRYAIIFVDRMMPADPMSSHLPDAAETAAVATELGGEYRGLLPEGARLVEVSAVRRFMSWEVADASRADPELSGIGPAGRIQVATFRRLHNGFPEGRLMVLVNSDGEVCGVINRMPKLELVGSYPVLSPEEAARTLNSAAARRHGLDDADLVGVPRIEGVEMEYYDGGRGRWPETIQPVYTFRGSAGTREGGWLPFAVTVPAVRPEHTERESTG